MLVLLAALPPPSGAEGGIEVTYIANEGFLISAGGHKVLIDALVRREFLAKYMTDAETVHGDMLESRPPFEGVELVLVTHIHSDHVDAAAALSHLKNNPDALLVGPEQVVESLAKGPDYAQVKSQVREVTPAPGKTASLTASGIHLKALRLRHFPYMRSDPKTGKEVDRHANIQNLGFVLDLGGNRVFHAGDSGVDNPAEYGAYRLQRDKLDVAFFAGLFLGQTEEKSRIVNGIGPRRTVLMHLGPRGIQGRITPEEWAGYPGLFVFQKPMQSQRF